MRSAFAPACENRARGNRSLSRFAVHERADIARTVTEQMLTQYPALQAIYAPCGGVEGIVDALRDSGRQQETRSGVPRSAQRQ
ncbi:LacI family transcriptional regulator [Klebsiella pneumoniae]|uniref:LacI family transcriptional regulator n=1 Tax=Klebsiella pneumoniae TaxID=573 RepID=A0A2X3DSQ4_KLEPN|nr:LacI family transcriptional regulator [Klebsiella pneumoniae]